MYIYLGAIHDAYQGKKKNAYGGIGIENLVCLGLNTQKARASGGFAPWPPTKGYALGSHWGCKATPKPPAQGALGTASAMSHTHLSGPRATTQLEPCLY